MLMYDDHSSFSIDIFTTLHTHKFFIWLKRCPLENGFVVCWLKMTANEMLPHEILVMCVTREAQPIHPISNYLKLIFKPTFNMSTKLLPLAVLNEWDVSAHICSEKILRLLPMSQNRTDCTC